MIEYVPIKTSSVLSALHKRPYFETVLDFKVRERIDGVLAPMTHL